MTKTKAAKDDTEFTAYPSYSMSILWSMRALTPEEFAHAAVGDTPLDGDALARAAADEARLAAVWETLDAAAADRLRNNHHEISRSNR